MKLIEIVRSVFLSVRYNKVRSFLTSLGIIIGTFTIILVVGIGVAGRQAVEEQYKRLSVESIQITQNMAARSRPGQVSSVKTLTKEQAMQMPNLLENVQLMSVSVRTSSEMSYGSLSQTASILGVNEAYAKATNLVPMYGDFITDQDGAIRNKVCVLGYNVADYLFDGDFENAVGEKVMIKGVTYTVVGILERIGGSGGIQSTGGGPDMSSSGSSDDMAFIPYEVALTYVSGGMGATGGNGQVKIFTAGGGTNYIALANDIDSVDEAISEIKEYIFEITGSETAYTVEDAGSVLASAQETAGTMSTLLMAVAAIVLLVSGIGIMNVMLVSVKERTREIGILKSIGSTRSVILKMFIFEAILISLFGGAVGVALSYFAPTVLSYGNIDYLSSIQGILLGLIFSIATGLFFGFYPAFKASKQLPIDSLNYE